MRRAFHVTGRPSRRASARTLLAEELALDLLFTSGLPRYIDLSNIPKPNPSKPRKNMSPHLDASAGCLEVACRCGIVRVTLAPSMRASTSRRHLDCCHFPGGRSPRPANARLPRFGRVSGRRRQLPEVLQDRRMQACTSSVRARWVGSTNTRQHENIQYGIFSELTRKTDNSEVCGSWDSFA